MGWASGGEIFDSVADDLIRADAPDALKLLVLSGLIDRLQNKDWDTEDESLERYLNDPIIVQAFEEHGIKWSRPCPHCGRE